MIEELGGVPNPMLSRDMMMYQVSQWCMWISVSATVAVMVLLRLHAMQDTPWVCRPMLSPLYI